MAAFVKPNHGYNLGDKTFEFLVPVQWVGFVWFFNFLGSKGWEELAVVEKTKRYHSRTCWFCEYRVKWVFTVKGLKILLLGQGFFDVMCSGLLSVSPTPFPQGWGNCQGEQWYSVPTAWLRARPKFPVLSLASVQWIIYYPENL